MPYIKENDRLLFNIHIISAAANCRNKGDLEYCIFKLMTEYKNKLEFNYSNLHDITYAAHHCGDEFRRRFLDKREDCAREVNGNIE